MGNILSRSPAHSKKLPLTGHISFYSNPIFNSSKLLPPPCAKLSQSMSAKLVSRWVTPAGSSTASSTASSPTEQWTKTPSRKRTTHSRPSSIPLAQANTSPAQLWSIWSHLSSMPSENPSIQSSTTPSSSSLAKKTRQTTTLVATTPSARRSSTMCSTESVSCPTTVPVFRVSLSSIPSVAAPVPASPPFLWSVSRSTTAKRLSSSSRFTPLLRSLPPLLSPTIQS